MELAERLFLTRRGAIIVAIVAALLAGIILFFYVRETRNNANTNAVQSPVLVARSLIQKGTPGTAVGTEHLYEIQNVPKTSLLAGAYTDPAALTSSVAIEDIYPGQQLTSGLFAAEASSLDAQLTGPQRALMLPIDATRTLGGQLTDGDHVDVYYSSGSGVREILQNVPVLITGNGSTVTVRVTSKQAALLALAVDSGRIWLTLRPRVGARPHPPVTATPQNLQGAK